MVAGPRIGTGVDIRLNGNERGLTSRDALRCKISSPQGTVVGSKTELEIYASMDRNITSVLALQIAQFLVHC